MWQNAKNQYHLLVATLANCLYGFPARKLTIIGVTGTDGKTTTANLIYHMLHTAGYPVSVISTVGAVIQNDTSDIGFHVTTPSSLKLQSLLKKIGQTHEKQYVVLEVTSHSLDQYRVWGIPFTIGVLTNVTHEHLDYHKTYDNYVKTKTRLLNMASTAVVNKDDASVSTVKKYLTNSHVKWYSVKNAADMTPNDISIPQSFLGEYNRYNALAAAEAALLVGVSKKDVEKALKTFVFPKGRTEIVYDKDFTVMVDFAHTPNAFRQLLSALRPRVKGRLIHVFGSAAKRDITKRPLMGEYASMYDDVMVLTSEDPRNENPEKIMDDIQSGIKKRKGLQVLRIADRRLAIDTAIALAQKGDFVVCTGKSHEKSMNMGHGEEAWDEFEAVKEALRKKHI